MGKETTYYSIWRGDKGSELYLSLFNLKGIISKDIEAETEAEQLWREKAAIKSIWFKMWLNYILLNFSIKCNYGITYPASESSFFL